MTLQIDQDLAVRGVAQVIVTYTEDDHGARQDAMRSVEKYFMSSKLSQINALALAKNEPAPPPVIHFRHLGVSLGTVDRIGLSALRAEKGVAQVSASPVLSLIRPV